jgi:mRNA interferase MazF
MSSASSPQRGDVWLANLDPTFGHEQSGRRPVLVVSVDPFNAGLSGLVVVLPITSRIRPLPLHVPVNPPEGGLRIPSAILCDAVRSIDRGRLIDC